MFSRRAETPSSPSRGPTATTAAIASAVGMMTGPIIILRIFPFVLKPISQEFGWGRATFSLVLTIASLTSAVLYPLTGRLIDRLGARAVAVPGMLILVGTTMSLSLMSASKAQLVFQFFLLGLAGAASATLPFTKVIASWFTKRRGLALALLVGGAQSASGFFLAWLAQWAVAGYGWRLSWVIFGAVPLLSLPVLCFWLKERPLGAPRAGAAPNEVSAAPGDTVKEALRNRNFWLLVSGLLLASMVSQGLTQHLVAMLTDDGVSPLAATSAAAVGPVAVVLGQLIMGFTIDRVPTPRVVVPFLMMSALGLFLLTRTDQPLLVNIAAFLFSLGVGAEHGFGAYVITRYFGLRNFSAIYGYLGLWTALCTGLGPTVYGAAFDYFGSYEVIVAISLGALCLSGFLLALLSPYRYSADLNEAAQSEEPRAAVVAETPAPRPTN